MTTPLHTSKEWLLRRIFSFKESEPIAGAAGVLANVWDLPPDKAIEAFEAKGYAVSWDWRDTWKEAHAKAFTVAKGMKLDILSDIRGAVDTAMKSGETFGDFKKKLAPILKAKGWWGKVPVDMVPHDPDTPPPEGVGGEVWLGSPWRLQTIFRTNLQSSMMAGRYVQMSAQIKNRPYWQYIAVMDASTRPDHAMMHGRIFLANDPIWNTWYPPNGFNCRCRVKSLSGREIARDKKIEKIEVTEGIVYDGKGDAVAPDEGFNYNPGRSSLAFLQRIAAEKLRELEKSLGTKIPAAHVGSAGGTRTGFLPPEDDVVSVRSPIGDVEEIPPASASLPLADENFRAGEALADPSKVARFWVGGKFAIPSHNGIPFSDVPEDTDFSKVKDKPLEGDPPMFGPKKKAAGTIVVEDDGRVWLVQPKGQFGGYEATFPKGTKEKNHTTQQTAIKETFEESGLMVELVDVLGDYQKTTGKARYYFARRTGGKPWKHGDESQGVKLVPLNELEKHLNVEIDKTIAKDIRKAIEDARMLGNGNIWKGFAQHQEDLRDVRLLKEAKARAEAEARKAEEEAAKSAKVATSDPVPGRPSIQFPESVEGLKPIRRLGGSTGAQLVEDPKTGNLFVMKSGNSDEHIESEYYADEAYRVLGVSVPEARLYQAGARKVKLARFIQGGVSLRDYLAKATAKEREAILDQIAKCFAVDAILGNYDVVGMEQDNILIKDGIAWRIDNGGSMEFRAQGARKETNPARTKGFEGHQYTDFPVEFWTMRNHSMNANTSSIFRRLTAYQIADQVEALDDAALNVLPEAYRKTLQARIRNMKEVVVTTKDFQKDGWKAEYADEIAKHMIGMRKAGVFDGIAKRLTVTVPASGLPSVLDENGKPYDNLRRADARSSGLVSSSVYDPETETIYNDAIAAAKTINYHNSAHPKALKDMKYNEATLKKFEAHIEKLKEWAYGIGVDPEKAAFGKYYLNVWIEIQAAKGLLTGKVGMVELKPLKRKEAEEPTKKPAPAKSVPEMVDDYMKTVGGSWEIINRWASAQGNCSKNLLPTAVKYLLKEAANVPDTMFYSSPTKKNFVDGLTGYGFSEETFRTSWAAHHAMVQEILRRIPWAGKDIGRRLMRVMRTEKIHVVVPTVGKKGVYRRGVNESYFMFSNNWAGNKVVLSVPFVRVTGLYLVDRDPDTYNGMGMFLGDCENEATVMAHGLEAVSFGAKTPPVASSEDASTWEVATTP